MRWGLFSSRSRCSSSIWFDVIGFSFLMPLCLHCRLCWSVFNSSCCCCYCYMRTLFNSASVAAAAASTSRRAPAPRAVTRPPASASVSSPSLRPRSLGLLLSCAMFLMLRVLMWMPRTALLLRADLIRRISMRLLSRRGCSNWDAPSWFVISGHNFSAFPVAVACWMHSLISQWELLVNGDVCGHENGDVVAGMLDACMSISLLFC